MEECEQVGDPALDGEDAGRGARGLAADDERAADDVAVEGHERRVRAFLRAVERLGHRADDRPRGWPDARRVESGGAPSIFLHGWARKPPQSRSSPHFSPRRQKNRRTVLLS